MRSFIGYRATLPSLRACPAIFRAIKGTLIRHERWRVDARHEGVGLCCRLFLVRFPSGMEWRLFCKLRRQITLTRCKHYKPPPFNHNRPFRSRRESLLGFAPASLCASPSAEGVPEGRGSQVPPQSKSTVRFAWVCLDSPLPPSAEGEAYRMREPAGNQ